MKNVLILGTIVLILGCSHTVKPVVGPPTIVEVSKFVPLPAECQKLQPVELPPGSTAMDVMNKQHEAILSYEDQVKRCFSK